MSRIVSASIGPIKAKDLRLVSLDLPKVTAEEGHPITKTLRERLPLLDLEGLNLLKKHMATYNGRVNSMSRLEDVQIWMSLVDREIKLREISQRNAVASLLALFVSPERTA